MNSIEEGFREFRKQFGMDGCEERDDDKEFDVLVKEGYEPLFDVLLAALDQAQLGKGHERHATGKTFTQQPIMQLRRMVGSGYTLGQAMKKAQESQRLSPGDAETDLLGAINYLAAEVLARREECQS